MISIAHPDFRDKLKQISTDNHRSMSAEIISRLEKTFIEDEAKKKR